MGINKEAEELILNNHTLLLNRVSNYPHTQKIAEYVGWKKLGDQVLDYGMSRA